MKNRVIVFKPSLGWAGVGATCTKEGATKKEWAGSAPNKVGRVKIMDTDVVWKILWLFYKITPGSMCFLLTAGNS